MVQTRRELLLGAAAVGLAGCLGGPGASAGGDGSATVNVRNHDGFGDVLVDADGLTLYRFDADEAGAGASACSGGCADAWPPLTVDGDPSAGSGVDASLTTFERSDGATQVAADGWPLYRYASDTAPGDVAGQGVNDAWWLVAPDGAKVTEKAANEPGY